MLERMNEMLGVAVTTPIAVACDDCGASADDPCYFTMLHGVTRNATVPGTYHVGRKIKAGHETDLARTAALRARVAKVAAFPPLR